MSVYIAPDIEKALIYRKEHDCIIMAGGSDLMVSASRGAGAVPHFDKDVLFIRNVKELSGIEFDAANGTVTIGCCTTSNEIAADENVPWILRQAAGNMGAVALRNSATIGGNIANASPKGDMPGPLYLLDAVINIESLDGGVRSVPISDFIIKFRTIDLHPDEIIRSVTVPVLDSDMSYWFHHKIGMRAANAISKLTVCMAMKTDGKTVSDFRIAATACGAITNRSRKIEEQAIGLSLSDFAAAADKIASDFSGFITPRAMPEFRKEAAKRLIVDFVVSSSGLPKKKFMS